MKKIVWVMVSALVLGACERKEPQTPAIDTSAVLQSDRMFSMEGLSRGAMLFQKHCAQCHGPEAQGHPDWENPKVVAAPPLNGTGNVWKRRRLDLVAIIKNGATRQGQQVMPAWKKELNDQEIEDVIVWFQALWPTDVYERWRKANASGGTPRG